ncbi:hypothetical protein AUJ77_02510 [Candidatus Nomurabacteria bacterium CG1_02_43_90]|uniref:Uncharacterized protein n=1 Tax=Candidatus Nomurabacteria bacterium CG1_02_43_90 TaxID=1805281 RepID=A0A1J4V5V5_9BACT|nr:MAG: hypothetical protein AUJ77_02510 [Candidatus Nomurabacteria bacterium CG1_02_43_90]
MENSSPRSRIFSCWEIPRPRLAPSRSGLAKLQAFASHPPFPFATSDKEQKGMLEKLNLPPVMKRKLQEFENSLRVLEGFVG